MENQSNDQISSDVRLFIGSKRETLDHSGKDCHHQIMPRSLVKETHQNNPIMTKLLTVNNNYQICI